MDKIVDSGDLTKHLFLTIIEMMFSHIYMITFTMIPTEIDLVQEEKEVPDV